MADKVERERSQVSAATSPRRIPRARIPAQETQQQGATNEELEAVCKQMFNRA